MEPILSNLIKALPAQIEAVQPRCEFTIIDTNQPLIFWGTLMGALRHRNPVAIIDPTWPNHWKRQYTKIASDYFGKGHRDDILIPTSGSSGQPRFCIHTLQTLLAAANAFRERFQPDQYLHAVNVLPANHIGGLMPVFRSAACGGRVCFSDYREPVACTGIDPAQASISVVPTQLNRMLASDSTADVLKQFGLILVGGSACPDTLLRQCRHLGLRLAPCYGSTETAAMATVLHPEQFLVGESGVGRPLPGMSVTIGNEQRVEIQADSIVHGFVPEKSGFSRTPFTTDDLGQIDSVGNLHILGRADNVINTGGRKVLPERIETACWESGMVKDVRCSCSPDPDWGQRVELDVVFKNAPSACLDALQSFLKAQLPAYAVPKEIRPVATIKRNAMGKVSHLD